MFSRKNRLQKDWLIEKIRRRGVRIQNQIFRLQIGRKSNGKEPRFTVVVSLKTSRLATKRNLLKRRIREACKNILPRLKAGFDIVIVATPRSLSLSQAEIQAKLTDLLAKRGYLKK